MTRCANFYKVVARSSSKWRAKLPFTDSWNACCSISITVSLASASVIRAYLIKLTGLSRAQTTRLIARWNETRQVRPLPPDRPSFPRRYRPSDIALLAQVDAAHEDLSGPAIRRILQREYSVL